MSAQRVTDIKVRLADLAHLFATPEPDYFSADGLPVSGLEQIMRVLKTQSLRRPARVTILLPTGQAAATGAAKVKAALAQYAEHRIQENQGEIVSLRWRGLKALQSGLVFLATCLFLSTFFENWGALPPAINRLLGEGFLIAGWVSIWHPTELFLYEWWPHSREIQLHQHLAKAEVTVEAAEP